MNIFNSSICYNVAMGKLVMRTARCNFYGSFFSYSLRRIEQGGRCYLIYCWSFKFCTLSSDNKKLLFVN